MSGSADTFNVMIDGTSLLAGPLGFDCTGFSSFTASSTLVGTITQQIDNVRLAGIDALLFADGFESGDLTAWTAPSGPAWDRCTTAVQVTDATASYLFSLGSNTASGVADSCGGGATAVDGWFEYQASCTGEVVFTTCHPGTQFDTVVSVWDDCPPVTELACNDDDAVAPPACQLDGLIRKSTAYFNVTVGDTLYLRVRSFSDTPVPGTDAQFSVVCNPTS